MKEVYKAIKKAVSGLIVMALLLNSGFFCVSAKVISSDRADIGIRAILFNQNLRQKEILTNEELQREIIVSRININKIRSITKFIDEIFERSNDISNSEKKETLMKISRNDQMYWIRMLAEWFYKDSINIESLLMALKYRTETAEYIADDFSSAKTSISFCGVEFSDYICGLVIGIQYKNPLDFIKFIKAMKALNETEQIIYSMNSKKIIIPII